MYKENLIARLEIVIPEGAEILSYEVKYQVVGTIRESEGSTSSVKITKDPAVPISKAKRPYKKRGGKLKTGKKCFSKTPEQRAATSKAMKESHARRKAAEGSGESFPAKAPGTKRPYRRKGTKEVSLKEMQTYINLAEATGRLTENQTRAWFDLKEIRAKYLSEAQAEQTKIIYNDLKEKDTIPETNFS